MAKRPLFINNRPKKGLIAWLIQHWQFWLTSILACIGTWLVVNQNQLMKNQNTLIERQMALDEASRRSALVMLMSNIMDKVDDEIKDQKNELYKNGLSKAEVDTVKFSLSQSLIGQIAALSHSFKPYKYMEADTMIKWPLSPERGQLLITLSLLPLDTSSLNKIFLASNFRSADVMYANLSYKKLKNIDLSKANLHQVNLNGSDLSDSNLTLADFTSSSLIETNFSNARMNGAKLVDCVLHGANFKNADLSFLDGLGCVNCPVKEDTVVIKGADLKGSDLRGASFVGANLSRANLSETTLGRFVLPEIGIWNETSFIDADLNGVDFSYAEMIHNVNITIDQAKSVKSFYECTGLHDSVKNSLQKDLPKVFQKTVNK
jgi:uncharacterized protein YjbI with pentapeptide repeats